MNKFAGWLLAVSALSLIVSVTSTLVSLFALRASREIAMHTATFQLHRFADEMSARNPQLLELHGITLEELAEEGVSAEELFYVYYSFCSGPVKSIIVFKSLERLSCPIFVRIFCAARECD